MKDDIPELVFSDRADFRRWLSENSQESGGVWLVFGKGKSVKTLSANEALEEALCFGWIDGQMQSIDEAKYHKYFTPRRKQSVWSEKNKAAVSMLREKGMMTEYGEAAVSTAQSGGMWDAPKREPISEEQTARLAEKLIGNEPAYTNFLNMPPSIKRTYTAVFLAPKSEETRVKTLDKIIDRLNKNLKPM